MDLNNIEASLKPLIEKSGYSLYDLEFMGRTLRISIEKPGGVSLQDCVEVSRLLNPILDVENTVPEGSYELEVSSPGLNRKLRRFEHFLAALGEIICVATTKDLSTWNTATADDSYFSNRKHVKGVLKRVDERALDLLSIEGKAVYIPLEAVVKAEMHFELQTTPKKGKKG